MVSQSSEQTIPVDSLREVLRGADELTHCPDIDHLFLYAVEFARARLGLERCVIFLKEEGFLTGTYGTDMRGQTTDEHNQRFPLNPQWLQRIQALETSSQGWAVVEETHYEWANDTAQPMGQGWIALTPIHST